MKTNIILKLLFFAGLLFHLFINKEQVDVIYIIVIGLYLVDVKINKRKVPHIFLNALALLAAVPLVLLFEAQLVAEILADYVYLLFLVGLVYQYLRMLRKVKKNRG